MLWVDGSQGLRDQILPMRPTEGANTSDTMLGKGVYDLVDVARLIRRQPETVARWTQGERSLHTVPPSAWFCFLDVISLYVISELRKRCIPLRDIRRGGEYLADKLDTRHPFAHQRLATVGGAFFGELGNWYDLGKRGQGTFEIMIEKVLNPIEYGLDDLAAIWRPTEGVWVNPLIQAGSPCIDGTRVPTRVVAGMAAAGEPTEDIAHDFALEIPQVEAALAYERAA